MNTEHVFALIFGVNAIGAAVSIDRWIRYIDSPARWIFMGLAGAHCGLLYAILAEVLR